MLQPYFAVILMKLRGYPFIHLTLMISMKNAVKPSFQMASITFLYWTICPKGDLRRSYPSPHRHVLSLGQDIIYMGKGGKVRTPKHTGMSITCHKMTQSKTLIGMLNRNGQRISYDKVQWMTQHELTCKSMQITL